MGISPSWKNRERSQVRLGEATARNRRCLGSGVSPAKAGRAATAVRVQIPQFPWQKKYWNITSAKTKKNNAELLQK
ncbi:MAG: hypothetical protein COT36_01570 [Parcubacteria group bacterium CG08_land_8_20_14_0_20_38_56]|nr:MAG: hypothetical protein COT36_01570 [Parcubacteria group bacterium CG08_land_8_20_14_0_20_38_56]